MQLGCFTITNLKIYSLISVVNLILVNLMHLFWQLPMTVISNLLAKFVFKYHTVITSDMNHHLAEINYCFVKILFLVDVTYFKIH